MSNNIYDILGRLTRLDEGLNAQQKSVPQLPADARAKHISVLDNKTDPEHPFDGYMVGADESAEPTADNEIDEDSKGYKSATGGLTKKGRDHYNRTTGSNLKAPVTTKPSKLKPGSKAANRRKSFCARMGGNKGPMKKPNGDPTRKALALRKWNCESVEDMRELVENAERIIAETKQTMDNEKRLGPDKNDPYEKGWKARPSVDFNPYEKGTQEYSQWQDGYDERRSQPDHYDETISRIQSRKDILAELKAIEQGSHVPDESIDETSWEKALSSGGSALGGVAGAALGKGKRRATVAGSAVGSALGTSVGRYIDAKLDKKVEKVRAEPVAEAVTKEDVVSKLKAKLGDYLSDLSKEIRHDPDLKDKISAKSNDNEVGPPVKKITTDDGHEISIHGNEDDGFRISIKDKSGHSKFKNLDEAVMACEMYCARRRSQQQNADYVDES